MELPIRKGYVFVASDPKTGDLSPQPGLKKVDDEHPDFKSQLGKFSLSPRQVEAYMAGNLDDARKPDSEKPLRVVDLEPVGATTSPARMDAQPDRVRGGKGKPGPKGKPAGA